MGTNLCSCDVLKENKNTIFLTYFADNQNNDNLGISFETNNSFSIMKVNPVLSIENIKDNQESSSINTKLIFDKLVNGNNNN